MDGLRGQFAARTKHLAGQICSYAFPSIYYHVCLHRIHPSHHNSLLVLPLGDFQMQELIHQFEWSRGQCVTHSSVLDADKQITNAYTFWIPTFWVACFPARHAMYQRASQAHPPQAARLCALVLNCSRLQAKNTNGEIFGALRQLDWTDGVLPCESLSPRIPQVDGSDEHPTETSQPLQVSIMA